MEELTLAMKDADRYDQYMRIKIIAQGYLIWAAILFFGSIISYLIQIFGDGLEIEKSYIDVAVFYIWVLLAGVGILFGFRTNPETHVKVFDEEDEKIRSNIGKAWFFSFIIGYGIGFGLAGLSMVSYDNASLLSVVISLGLGNLSNYFLTHRGSSIPLFMGVSILGLSSLILFIDPPYTILVFGVSLGLPYYITGFYLYVSKLPTVLKKRE